MIAPWQLWKLIWIDLVLSYTPNPTFFEPAVVHPIQKIRWVMTLEMFGGLFSGNVEKRTLADFRRSGAHEAIAGDAQPAALAHAMGNTLHASNALFRTRI